jgi:hypothetical protein
MGAKGTEAVKKHQIVLSDDNFASIAAATSEEGRVVLTICASRSSTSCPPAWVKR